jgi:hypothetical protein
MGTETSVTDIDDLNKLWPLGSDPASTADNHLRFIKTALVNDFAGFTGAVAVTGTDGGAVNAYTLTPTNALVAYGTKMLAVFSPTATNTGAVTLNISGLGAKSVKSIDGVALVAGDLAINTVCVAIYNGTEFRLIGVTKNYVDQLAFSSALPGLVDASKLFSDGVTASFIPATVITATGSYVAPVTGWYIVDAYGGGGGGGSGRRGAAGTVRNGGAGAGGGAHVRKLVYLTKGDSITCTIGAGGTAGAAVAVNDTSGIAGGIGGTTSFGTLVVAYGGGGGAGGEGPTTSCVGGSGGGEASAGQSGTTADNSGRPGGDPTPVTGLGTVGAGNIGPGGAGSVTGGSDGRRAEDGGASGAGCTAGAASLGAGSLNGGAGGGAGGGITSGNVVGNGGAGGKGGEYVASSVTPGGAGGIAGAAGTTNAANTQRGGDGGGGGGASATANAGAGANGSAPCGGAGGGGAALNGFNSGAGGVGGRGEIRVRPI